MLNSPRKIRHRKCNGFSLVSVVVTASLTSLFLLASAATILPLYKSIGGSYTDVRLSAAAQSATDLTIGLLNDSASRSTFDCPHTYGAFSKVNDNYALLPAMFGLPETASVEVWVRNYAPMPEATGVVSSRSLSFDPILSPSNDGNLPAELISSKERWGLYQSAGANAWRVIECRVKLGSTQKLLLTTLKPVLVANTNAGGTVPLFSDKSTMVGAGRGLNSIMIGTGSNTFGVAQTGSSHLTAGGQSVVGDVASFNRVVIDSGAQIGGKAQILKDSTGFASGKVSAIDSTATVSQYVQSDGNVARLDTSNVLNGGDASNSDTNFRPTTGDAVNGDSVTMNPSDPNLNGVAPAPSAPSTAETQVSVTANSGNSTVPGKDLVVPSIRVSSGSSLLTDPSASAPTRVFLEGTNSGGQVVDIQGNLNPNGDASSFQIYYNGTGTIRIQGTQANALIYAPNANVILGSSSGNLKFTGAITARNIAGAYDSAGNPVAGITNTELNLDYSSRILSTGSGTNSTLLGLRYDPNDVLNPRVFKVHSVLEPRNPNDPKYSH